MMTRGISNAYRFWQGIENVQTALNQNRQPQTKQHVPQLLKNSMAKSR
jgi:hypothetical protein